MARDPVEALVLPVGHYLGPLGSGGHGQALSHRVRVGAQIRRLAAGDPLAVWLLAHGLPDQIDKQPWTDAAMLSALPWLDERRLQTALVGLEADGLLVRVAPDKPAAVGMAHRYRLRPLLVGLGWRPEWVGHGVGLTEPVAVMTDFVHEIWRWGPATGTLWSLCEVFAAVDHDDGGPRRVLGDVLRNLHQILANRAGYLDEI
jgi:hypothetical protein